MAVHSVLTFEMADQPGEDPGDFVVLPLVLGAFLCREKPTSSRDDEVRSNRLCAASRDVQIVSEVFVGLL